MSILNRSLVHTALILALTVFSSVKLHSSSDSAKETNHSAKDKNSGSHAESKPDPKEMWAAFNKIQDGNHRFVEGDSKHEKQDSKTREKLAEGQKPPVIILSCSDSRVPPEMIFDQGLGEIFTVRIAGHVANTEAIASIEYALEHLGSKVLVVMGHDSCGAVKAAMTTPDGKSAGSPHLDSLIAKIKPAIRSIRTLASEDKTLSIPVKANVTATVKNLIKRSAIIREFVESEKLLIAQGIYHLASGKVEFWNVGQPLVFIGGREVEGRDVAEHKSTQKKATH